MFLNFALDKDSAFLGIKPTGQIINYDLLAVLGDRGFMLIFRRKRMKIRDHKKRIVALKLFVIFDRAKKVPDMKLSGWPGSA